MILTEKSIQDDGVVSTARTFTVYWRVTTKRIATSLLFELIFGLS